MVVTITTPSKKMLGVGVFEALKMGLETQVYGDTHFDLVVHDQMRTDIVVNACNGTIISITDSMNISPYRSAYDNQRFRERTKARSKR